MNPINVTTKAQTWIHIGLMLAQFAVMIFVKNPQTKSDLQTGLALLQGSGAVGMQDQNPKP